MTRPDRVQLSSVVRKKLRDHFGLWPMFEARNKLRYAPATRRWRTFEDAEVSRLSAELPTTPTARVATVMPTFRRPNLLASAVESALAQSVVDQVVIVVDDGGGEIPTLPNDPRLTVTSLSRNSHVLGLVRNVGIRLTASDYIAFLDDDNAWREDHLANAIEVLERGPQIVYTAVERRLADGTVLDVLSHPFDRREFSDVSSYVDANSLVVRRDPGVIFSRIPRIRETLPKEDWEFVYRLSRTRRVEHLPVATVRYLVNSDSFYTSWDLQEPGPSD